MKTPSRLMPQYVPEKPTTGIKVAIFSVLGLILVALAYAIWTKPLLLAFFIALVMLGVYAYWNENCRLKNLAADRIDEGICTFARSFDRKQVDTWIIRAVHDELQGFLDFFSGVCPLRASDRFEEDLKVDVEDLDDLLIIIAQRTGRSIEETEKNPYYNKVNTVGDMVLFINSQPKLNT